MAQVKGDMIYATVSAAVSAGDGIIYDFTTQQPPTMPLAPTGATGAGSVSNPQIDMLEMFRRSVTHITSPSNVLIAATSGCAVALDLGGSGVQGLFHGMPFTLSGAANRLSAQLSGAMSTTSNQIRKILVCIGMSAIPASGTLANGGGTLQVTYGPAFTTSGGAALSGAWASTISYFDYVPLPRPSAGEIPVGWINVGNSTLISATIPVSTMITDYRAMQGLNMSAMLA